MLFYREGFVSKTVVVRAGISILIAFIYSIYTSKTTGISWSGAQVADTLVLGCGLFVLFNGIAKIKRTPVRILTASLISIAISLFFIGNVFYYQVFNDWVHVELFGLWSVGSSVVGGVFKNVTVREVSLALLLPLGLIILFAIPQYKKMRFAKRTALSLATIFLVIQGLLASDQFCPSENNFLVNLGREAVVAAVTKNSNGAGAIRADLYPKPDSSTYIPAGDTTYPLLKKPAYPVDSTKKLNVVLVLMESVRAKESGSYGAEISMTPAFDSLAKEGILFKNFYANGTQTVRGELSLLCSFYPNFSGSPIYVKRPELKLSTLPGILGNHGYKTMWISGYKSSYSNKAEFLLSHGIDTMYDGSELNPDSAEQTGWGYSDKAIFDYAETILDKQKEPFFAEVMTLSNHWPFEYEYSAKPDTLPESVDTRYLNYCRGIYYTDWAVGQFMERMKTKPYFDNTLFIITSDHGIWYFPPEDSLSAYEKQEAYFRMPLLLYAPAHLSPDTSNIVASQVDVAPTVLELLGIREENSFVGQDMFNENPSMERFALMQHVQKWNFRRGNEYIYSVGSDVYIEHRAQVQEGASFQRQDSHWQFTSGDDLFLKNRRDIEFPDSFSIDKKEVTEMVQSNQVLLFGDRVFPGTYK